MASPASVVVAEDGATGVRLHGTDSDGTVTGYRVETPPTNGALSGTAPDLVYTPDADFHGQDEFTFTVTDDDGARSAPATVTVEVTPVNDPPVALAQTVSVVGGESVDIALEGSDVDGVVAGYSIETQPDHGTLAGTAPDLTYSADASYAGADAFTFTVTDDVGAVSVAATVAIEVTPALCRGDHDVLEAFYWATEGDGWAEKDGWLLADDLDEWHGVDADGLCVTGIQLPENHLQGTLPWELGSLARLRVLDLGNDCSNPQCRRNVLTGPIPREFGSLTDLETLRLSDNELAGPIPVEIGNLANLVSLNLDLNSLSGPIPVVLADLTDLELLRLYGNALSGPIPVELGDLTSLHMLDLRLNELRGPVPTELADLTGLESLLLDGNALSGPIPVDLANLTNLRWLSLGHNALSGPVPVELGNLAGLRWLDLRSNQLSGPIPVEFARLDNLEALWLAGNNLSGPIPQELAALVNLVSIVLDNNNLSGPIPIALAGLERLGELDLSGNSLSGPIPPELGGLADLWALDLAGNALTGPIPDELAELSDLSFVSLEDNALSGAIPASLGSLPLMGRDRTAWWSRGLLAARRPSLLLGGNDLSDGVPPEIGLLTTAAALTLDRNQLTGRLPADMTSMTELDTFRFDDNDGLCAPGDADFLAWLAGIPNRDDGPTCE